MTDKQCLFCRTGIPTSAEKCRHCGEFQSINERSKISPEVTSSVLELIGKFAIPLTILAVALLFKPSIESLISKTEEAEFFGGKFKFTGNEVFDGTLSALELYYLIDSKDHGPLYGGGYNYEVLKSSGNDRLEAIEDLTEKGLITFKITENTGDAAKFGKESLSTFHTEKGLSFVEVHTRSDSYRL